MSTVKITQLAEKTTLNSNTSNTIFVGVDLPTGITSKYTATTVAYGLYKHNPLNVGSLNIQLPNTVAQFVNSSSLYIQTNLQNQNNDGTADYVVTANTGTDTTNYIDLGFTNSSYDNLSPYNSLGTSVNPLDGYLYAQGSVGGPGGSLVLGTTIPGTEIRFLAGGVNSENVVAKITENGVDIQFGYDLIFGDGSIQTVAGASQQYATAAYNQANTNASNLAANVAYLAGINAQQNTNISAANTFAQSGYNQANTVTSGLAANVAYFSGVNTQQNTNISAANTFAQAAFNKANAALANSSGIFGGNLIVTQRLSTNEKFYVNNSIAVGNTSLVEIIGSNNYFSAEDSNPGYMLHITGFDGIGSRLVNDTYSNTTADYSAFIARRARGTAQNPLAIQSGDTIARFGGNGYGNTKFSQFSDARIEFAATENFSDTSKGTHINFFTTSNGSNVATNIATFNGNTATFTGVVSPTKGFIFTPRILPGAQTAITVDFSSDSLIRSKFTSTITLIPANFVAGKVVEVWLTNDAGNGQSINHGVQANNSTTGSTSFSIPAGSTAYLRYFSIDGDLANTFVTASHA